MEFKRFATVYIYIYQFGNYKTINTISMTPLQRFNPDCFCFTLKDINQSAHKIMDSKIYTHGRYCTLN